MAEPDGQAADGPPHRAALRARDGMRTIGEGLRKVFAQDQVKHQAKRMIVTRRAETCLQGSVELGPPVVR